MAKPNPITSEELQQHAARFWSQVEQRGVDECWPWTGEVGGLKGYGRFRIGRKNFVTNRVAYILTYGPLAHFACHTCDNPPCCNPAHLYDGTPVDNALDSVARGRHVPRRCRPASEYRHAPTRSGNYDRGENVNTAKLTPALVRQLRKEFADGATTVELGKRYGITRVNARNIVIRKVWRHVD